MVKDGRVVEVQPHTVCSPQPEPGKAHCQRMRILSLVWRLSNHREVITAGCEHMGKPPVLYRLSVKEAVRTFPSTGSDAEETVSQCEVLVAEKLFILQSTLYTNSL